VVFTGAGISVASGIPDFRSADGIYNKETKGMSTPEEILSHSFFLRNTEEFYEFYKTNMVYENAKPNIAHKYFADLEKKNKNVIVITQNIDGLHRDAGNSIVYEIHGSTKYNYCEHCHKFFDVDYIMKSEGVPHCDKCGGVIKPDVVLYEEQLDSRLMEYSMYAIMGCECLIVVGTSLKVYPAAGFLRYFKGKYLVVINKERTDIDNQCDLVINEDVVTVIENLQNLDK
jgi:NAD-dependent deacetylase